MRDLVNDLAKVFADKLYYTAHINPIDYLFKTVNYKVLQVTIT